jgi:Mor family transcriptional regulator
MRDKSLPETLSVLLHLIPSESVQEVVRAYGGTRVKFRTIIGELSEMIGSGPAESLANHFGLEYVDIPLVRQWERETRNAEIRRDKEGGMVINEIARKHHISRRSVFRALNASEAE